MVTPAPVVPVVPVVEEEHKAIQTGFSVPSTPKQSTTFVPNVVAPPVVAPSPVSRPVVVAEVNEPEPKKKRSLMPPPPKRNPYRCYPPEKNRVTQEYRAEILSVGYDEEHSAVLITFRNWGTQPVILNRYTVALFDKKGTEIHRTSIGKSKFRYRGRLYIGKRARNQEFRDSKFAVVQRKNLKDVYPKLKEKHHLASAFVMFHRHLFDESWMEKKWVVQISCGEDVVFQYPPEVEAAPGAPSLKKAMLSTTWGALKDKDGRR